MIGLERQLMGRAAALLPFFADDAVTDILVNGARTLFVERAGRLVAEVNPFPDAAALHDFIERLCLPIGKRVDAAQPYLDGRLVDGSRFHVILPPIACEGPLISIRKFRRQAAVDFGAPHLLASLRAAARARENILIAGGTGSGKTTLLSTLLAETPLDERIAILEETRELKIDHPHAVSLEARRATPDGTGEVTLRDLLRNALRMRPDRIVLGEARGGEAFDLLQALNTGHPGSFCTIHASGARDALRRLENLALLAGLALPLRAIREAVAGAIQIVVLLERADGRRYIREAIRLHGLEGEVYRISPNLSELQRAK